MAGNPTLHSRLPLMQMKDYFGVLYDNLGNPPDIPPRSVVGFGYYRNRVFGCRQIIHAATRVEIILNQVACAYQFPFYWDTNAYSDNLE